VGTHKHLELAHFGVVVERADLVLAALEPLRCSSRLLLELRRVLGPKRLPYLVDRIHRACERRQRRLRYLQVAISPPPPHPLQMSDATSTRSR
jgi:hypothetical protein